MNEIEKNVKLQLNPSITGKNHKTDEYRSLFALPLKMERLNLFSETEFSRSYEWSRANRDPLENTDLKMADTEQTLINKKHTELQN